MGWVSISVLVIWSVAARCGLVASMCHIVIQNRALRVLPFPFSHLLITANNHNDGLSRKSEN
jgi:hypothetical protein